MYRTPAPTISKLNPQETNPEREVLTDALRELKVLRGLVLDRDDGLTQSILHLIQDNLQMTHDEETPTPVLFRRVSEQNSKTYTAHRNDPRNIAQTLYLYLLDAPFQPRNGVDRVRQDFEHTASILLDLPSKILITEALIYWMIQNPDSDFPATIAVNGQSVEIPGWAYSVVAEILDLQPQNAPTCRGLGTLRRGGLHRVTPHNGGRKKFRAGYVGFAGIAGLGGVLGGVYGIPPIGEQHHMVLAGIQGPTTSAEWCDPKFEGELIYATGLGESITVTQLLTRLQRANTLYGGMLIDEFLNKLITLNPDIRVQAWTYETILPSNTTIHLPSPAESASCQAYQTPTTPGSTHAYITEIDPTATETSGTQTYIVQPGDTLAEIATRYNVTVSDLQEWNDIVNPNVIVVGMTLVVTNPSDGEKTGTITTPNEDRIVMNPTIPLVCDPSKALNVDRRFQVAALEAEHDNPFLQWLESYNELDKNTTWGTQGWEEVFRRIHAGEALPTPVYLQALTVLYEIYTTESCNPLSEERAHTVREKLQNLAREKNPFQTNNPISPQEYEELLAQVNNIIMTQILIEHNGETDMGKAIRAFFDNSMSRLETELATKHTGRGIAGIYDGDLRTLYKSLMLIVLATDNGNINNSSLQSSLEGIRQLFQDHGNENTTSSIEILLVCILLVVCSLILMGLSEAIGLKTLKTVPLPDPISAIRRFWSGG